MKRMIAGLLAVALAGSAPAQPAAGGKLTLTRLDCGDFNMKRFGAWFSDTFQYPAGAKRLVGSCYLIRNGTQLMLWDTGMNDALIGKPIDNEQQTQSLKRSLVDQLRQIGVTPAQIATIGISHYHGDHTGQARHFTNARLLIGAADWAAIKDHPNRGEQRTELAHWVTGGGKVEPVPTDMDVFGDGKVIMLGLPGHTPGHTALLVRLASGPVLLSGDQYHFTEARPNRGVPAFNVNRADTLASHDRFETIARNLKAKVIIQHEPSDVPKLPAFPKAAE